VEKAETRYCVEGTQVLYRNDANNLGKLRHSPGVHRGGLAFENTLLLNIFYRNMLIKNLKIVK
jgi:hypothetical protein